MLIHGRPAKDLPTALLHRREVSSGQPNPEGPITRVTFYIICGLILLIIASLLAIVFLLLQSRRIDEEHAAVIAARRRRPARPSGRTVAATPRPPASFPSVSCRGSQASASGETSEDSESTVHRAAGQHVSRLGKPKEAAGLLDCRSTRDSFPERATQSPGSATCHSYASSAAPKKAPSPLAPSPCSLEITIAT